MRKAEFAVPSEVMAEFAASMAERELDNSIIGSDEDGDILVEVRYEKEEAESVDELEAYLDELREQIESEDDEDDEE